MTGWGSFFAAIAGPVAKRVLAALGFGVISYAGISVALNSMLSQAKIAWSGIAGETLQLVELAGVNTAASIYAGALVARVGLVALSKLGLIR